MSQVIQQYLNQLQDLRKVSETSRESVVREAFKDVLKGGRVPATSSSCWNTRSPRPPKSAANVDGALVHTLRVTTVSVRTVAVFEAMRKVAR